MTRPTIQLDGQAFVYIAGAVGLILVLTTFVLGSMIIGLDERSTPLVVSAVGTISTLLLVFVGALRAEEGRKAAVKSVEHAEDAVDKASHIAAVTEQTARTAEWTASKIGTIQQIIASAEACENPDCPHVALHDAIRNRRLNG